MELGGYTYSLLQEVLVGKWSGEMVVHVDKEQPVVYATSSKVESANGEIVWRFESVEKEGFANISNFTYKPISNGKLKLSSGEHGLDQYLEEHLDSNTIHIYSFFDAKLISFETISLRENNTRVRVIQHYSSHGVSRLVSITEKNISHQ